MRYLQVALLLLASLGVAVSLELGVSSCASSSPKLAAGETALINCAAQDFIGLIADVTSALMADDYQQRLADIANKNELRKDAVACAVKVVNAVVTAKPTPPAGAGSGSFATSSPSPIAVHAAAYLADKHFAGDK